MAQHFNHMSRVSATRQPSEPLPMSDERLCSATAVLPKRTSLGIEVVSMVRQVSQLGLRQLSNAGKWAWSRAMQPAANGVGAGSATAVLPKRASAPGTEVVPMRQLGLPTTVSAGVNSSDGSHVAPGATRQASEPLSERPIQQLHLLNAPAVDAPAVDAPLALDYPPELLNIYVCGAC